MGGERTCALLGQAGQWLARGVQAGGALLTTLPVRTGREQSCSERLPLPFSLQAGSNEDSEQRRAPTAWCDGAAPPV